MRFLLGLALACATYGCEQSPTEVVLVVDGEYAIPTEVDSIEVSVVSPDAITRTATATFGPGEAGLPRTLGIVHAHGADGFYVIDVVAKKGTVTVVERRARFQFVAGQRRMLRVDLLRACEGVFCLGNTTCGEGGLCESTIVNLEPWTGTIPTLDGGM